MAVGVLALQGCIDPHVKMLERLGAEVIKVRLPEDLQKIDRLIMPGGESTTMLTLLDRAALFEPLKAFGKTHPVWGICAGAILAAEKVEHPDQRSLGIIPICATRNYYGSQLDSFKARVTVHGLATPLEVDFIRAPLLRPLDSTVLIEATLNGQAIMLRKGLVLTSSFHSELGSDTRLHELFLKL